MTIDDYQTAAMRTAPHLSDDELIENAAMGLNGEAGELIDHIKKYKFQGHSFDRDYVAKELGDIAWYLAIGAFALDLPLETILEMNVNKLKQRYPDGFTVERSINREE